MINEKYKDLGQYSEKFSLADPFPHVVLDDFLQRDYFDQINAELRTRQDVQLGKYFDTSQERNKAISLNTNLPLSIKKLVDFLNTGAWIDQLKTLSRIQSLIGTEIGNTKLANYHEMRENGFLGAHVDHGQEPVSGLPHVLNIVYYISDDWLERFGGSTVLFDKAGMRAVTSVTYKPNRAIIFLHTPYSFHGVTAIDTNAGIARKTLYVDYYATNNDPYKELPLKFSKKWFAHPTTFKLENPLQYFSPNNFPYLKAVTKYHIQRVARSVFGP